MSLFVRKLNNMRLVVGLGNPGKEYEKSKHNIGYICLDAFAKANNIKFSRSIKFHGEIIQLKTAILLKPRTFMNNSGLAVLAVADYFHIEPENILVFSDDLDLPFAKLRLREKGGAGGHNGLRSIIEYLNTGDFRRCRIGIDRDENQDVINYVLGKFSKAQSQEIASLTIVTNDIITQYINEIDFDTIMNNHNGQNTVKNT
ncbi:MAG: aminoacyl-tRNA hydrolase [Candidatus Izemoplasmatales bacterium]|nr:aminoacyl-tRNA hydrolase [Candidatus Izemoplasmatales bacterium]